MNQLLRHGNLLWAVTAILISVFALSAEAAPGNGNANGSDNGNGPKKTPGLALVAIAALSSASYTGYKRLKNKEN